MADVRPELQISERESRRISILKVWLSVMVVFVHSWNEISVAGEAAAAADPAWLDTLKYTVSDVLSRSAIPAFFLLSAYFLYRKPFSWTENIRRKAKSLLVPWFILNTFWILVFFVGQHVPALSAFFAREETMISSWGFMDGLAAYFGSPANVTPLLYPLWFIRDLFILNLLAKAYEWFAEKAGFWSLLVFIPAWLLVKPNHPFIMGIHGLTFWGIGCCLAKQRVTLSSLDRFRPAALAYPVLVAATVLLRHNGAWGVKILYRLCLLAGVYFWFACTALVREGRFRDRLLSAAKYSFCIYLFHEMALTIVRKLLAKVLPQTPAVSLAVYACLPFAIVFGCVVFSRLLEKFLPKTYAVLSGGRTR